MNTLITYLVATMVSLGVFYTAYILFLRKESLFRFNRVYLLSSLFLSFCIPLITFLPEASSPVFMKTPGNGLIHSITLSTVEITASTTKIPSMQNILTILYLAGMVLFISRFFIRVYGIQKLKKNGIITNDNETTILWSHSDIPPFSFFGTMYLPMSLKSASNLTEIIRHEQVHIKSLHSFDILFTQMLQVIYWFNPFIYLVEKLLREVHEFEADKAVISSGTDPVVYTRLLFAQDKSALAVVMGNNFNYALIKRRLTMFYKKNTRYARLKANVVLPLAICIVMLYAIGCKQSAKKSSETAVFTEAPAQTTPAVQADGSVPPPPPPPPPSPPPPPTQNMAFKDPVFTVVENMPQFPGGDEARVKYMVENIKYPEQAKEQGLQGTVYVSFVVEKDGSISNTKVIKRIINTKEMGAVVNSLDTEALRVVSNMPKWKPGKQNGKVVRVQFNMPIYFKLN